MFFGFVEIMSVLDLQFISFKRLKHFTYTIFIIFSSDLIF